MKFAYRFEGSKKLSISLKLGSEEKKDSNPVKLKWSDTYTVMFIKIDEMLKGKEVDKEYFKKLVFGFSPWDESVEGIIYIDDIRFTNKKD